METNEFFSLQNVTRVSFAAQSTYGTDQWDLVFACLPAAEELWFTANLAALTTNFARSKFVQSGVVHPLRRVGNARNGVSVALDDVHTAPDDIHQMLAVDTEWDAVDIVYFCDELVGEYT